MRGTHCKTDVFYTCKTHLFYSVFTCYMCKTHLMCLSCCTDLLPDVTADAECGNLQCFWSTLTPVRKQVWAVILSDCTHGCGQVHFTLDRTSVHHQPLQHSFTHTEEQSVFSTVGGNWSTGREPTEAHGKAWVTIKHQSFLLWGDSAGHCRAMLPSHS